LEDLTEIRQNGWGLNLSGPGFSPVAGYCEHCYEPSGSIEGWKFRDQLNDYQLLMKDSELWCRLISVTCKYIQLKYYDKI